MQTIFIAIVRAAVVVTVFSTVATRDLDAADARSTEALRHCEAADFGDRRLRSDAALGCNTTDSAFTREGQCAAQLNPDVVLSYLAFLDSSDDSASGFEATVTRESIRLAIDTKPARRDLFPVVIQIIKSESLLRDKVRAVGLLKTFGSDAREAAPLLLRLVDSSEIELRRAAVSALPSVALASDEVRSVLIRVANDDKEDQWLRQIALEGLIEMGARTAEIAPILRRFLDSHNWELVMQAIVRLQQLPTDAITSREAMVERLRAFLKEEQFGVDAAIALWKVTGQADEAIESLVFWLNRPSNAHYAAMGLGKMGSAARPALLDLVALLGSERNRHVTAFTIWEITREPSVPVAALTSCLKSKDAMLRGLALQRLRLIGANASLAVEPIRSQLKSYSTSDQYYAVGALEAIGPKARVAVRDMIPLLKNGTRDVQVASFMAVSRLAPNDAEVRSAVQSFLQACDKETLCRSDICELASQHGYSANIVDRLLVLIKEPDPSRLKALYCLGVIGAKDYRIVSALTGCLKNESPHVRQRAALALGIVGESAENAVSHLKQLRCDTPFFVRWIAVDALNMIENRSAE
jgi:HEAT repeat protein